MSRQRGFGVIMAIAILVILASLGAAIVKFGTAQQVVLAQDALSARAWQAAKAGNEWGLYQALQGSSCVGDPGVSLDLSMATGFHVTVKCLSWAYQEGQNCVDSVCTPIPVTVFRIEALACNSAVSCPDNAAAQSSPTYVERLRQVVVTN